MNFDGLKKTTINLKPAAEQPEPEVSLLSWSAKNFERNISGKKIAFLVVLFVAFMGYSVWQRDWFVLIVFGIVAAVATWYFLAIKPREVSYSITAMGFREGNRFYPFQEIHSFWMAYGENVKELYFAFDRKYLPALSINISGVDPVLLRSILLRKIPEQARRRESLTDKAIRFLGL